MRLTIEQMKAAPVTVVVPFLNECKSLETLVTRIKKALTETGRDFEILLVDDGSTDGGGEIATQIARSDPVVRTIRFTRNFGKAAALSAGLGNARGDMMITMDADLQDDPSEIPRFLEKIAEGYDVVSGWKKIRHDPLVKRLPSKIFNRMTATLFGVDLHDINCGFKAYSRRAARSLNLYGELHRFTPALLAGEGFKVVEIEVRHHARQFGKSKYGTKRMIKGLLDLITVMLFTRYQARPLHFFAMLGLPLSFLGGLFLVYLVILWFAGLGPIGNRPLLFIGILFVLTGTQLIATGLIAELLQSMNLTERKKYVIDETAGFDEDETSTIRSKAEGL